MEEIEKIHSFQAMRTFTKMFDYIYKKPDYRLFCKACFNEIQRNGAIQVMSTDTVHFRSQYQIKKSIFIYSGNLRYTSYVWIKEEIKMKT